MKVNCDLDSFIISYAYYRFPWISKFEGISWDVGWLIDIIYGASYLEIFLILKIRYENPYPWQKAYSYLSFFQEKLVYQTLKAVCSL